MQHIIILDIIVKNVKGLYKIPGRWYKMKFENLGELQNQLRTLDRAEYIDLYKDDDDEFNRQYGIKEKLSNYRGIRNINTNTIASIKPNRYQIVQHKDVFEAFIDAATTLNLKCKGELLNYNNKAYLKVLFPELDLIPDDATGINKGLRLVNSYDGTTAIRGEIWGMRLICSNGMKIPGFEGIVSKAHVGEINLNKLMGKFIKNAILKSEALSTLINKAMGESFEWELAVTLFENMTKAKKHKNILLELLKKELYSKGRLSRWDIYNIITNYATHGNGELLSKSVEENFHNQAKQLLVTPTTRIRERLTPLEE